jgi:hypothetical protein
VIVSLGDSGRLLIHPAMVSDLPLGWPDGLFNRWQR